MARLFSACELRFSRDPRFAERDVSEPQLNMIARLFDRTYRFRIDEPTGSGLIQRRSVLMGL